MPFLVSAASLVVVASMVSVASIIKNMPDLFDIQAVARFFIAAFAHTDIVIKSALVAGMAFLATAVKRAFDGARSAQFTEA